MSAFASAITAGLAAIRTTAGVAVVYRREEIEKAIAKAVPSDTRVQVSNPATGAVLEIPVHDFLIAAADLAELTDSGGEPLEGDQIDHVGLDGVTRTWQVLSPGGDEPAWRYSDPSRTTVRLHTKLLAETAPSGGGGGSTS
jgi:hypothetical protein